MSDSVVQKDAPRTFKCTPGCIHPLCVKLPEKPKPIEPTAK